ncbi:MAG: TonB-dependent receptor [Acidobacteriaceae bacterium]|nr:TonB-dependent receptor [Acidobacteriaceae bacterium]
MRVHSSFALIVALWSASAIAHQSSQPDRKLDIVVLDPSRKPVPGAAVVVRGETGVTSSLITAADGRAALENPAGPNLLVSISREGFEAVENYPVTLSASGSTQIEITLAPNLQRKEQVDVRATADELNQNSSGSQVATSAARELPSRPATVGDALPLIPGVIRSPQGALTISGSGEHRSALIVNSADVTDPATGQFGTTVPIDSVETLNVYQTPFLAEYGRFTAGLVSVETRRGTDNWKWEINDPFPDFRIRSDHLRGLMDATPRLNLEGPLIPDKLFFSEGFEYEMRKVPVITLPFPENQEITQGINSFSQFDYIVSPTQLITAAVHVAPQQMQNVNMNAFNPESTVPDASVHNETATLADKLTVRQGDLFENTLSYTRFSAGVWAHGIEDLVITPEGNSGNYFAQQQRTSSRAGWLSTYSLHPVRTFGVHNVKVGGYLAGSSEDARIVERPFGIFDTSGNLLQQVSFTPGSPVHKADTEMSFFGQDHWVLSSRLAVDTGLRAESQALTDTLRLAPRVGIAWTPFAEAGTVIRAGIGLFYDRVPLNVFGFPHYPSQVVTTYNAAGQVVPGPIDYVNMLGQVDPNNPFVIHGRTPGNFSPQSTTWTLQMEQPLFRVLKLRASYMQNDGTGLVMLNPLAPPPGSALGSMLLTGNGQSSYRQLEVTARIRLQGDRQQLFLSYVRSRAQGDLNDFNNYLGSFPAPVIRPNQFGNLPSDLPNRVLMWGLLHFPYKIQLAPIAEWRSGFPYLVTNAAQAYVGAPYQQRYPNFLSIDARISKDVKINKHTVGSQ